MIINQRIFSANVGDSSVGIAGPDAIEQDIDNLLANDQELLGTLNDHEHTKSDITDFPSSLPADGGNADTVGGKTIWVGAESSKGTDANTIYFCY
jgi:hypothetical protein